MSKKWIAIALAAALIMALLPLGAAAEAQATISKKSAVIDLADGNTLQLRATVRPASYASRLVWKSGTPAIATVSDEGLVTAKRTGKVKIGVRVRGEGTWSLCTVRVVNTSSAPSSISVSRTSAQMLVGETLTLTATVKPSSASQAVTWQSSKPAVVSVSASGVLTARKEGKAQVRVTSAANKKLRKTVTVTVLAASAPTAISLSPNTDEMSVGDTLTLVATVSPEGASDKITWTSSNTAVASVSSSGVVTAKKAGSVTIRATSAVKSTVRATRKITVDDPDAVTGIKISASDMYLDKGASKTLTAVLTPSSSKAKVSWSSSDPTIVSVTTTGKITALKAGSAAITAKAGGKSDNIEVRVLSDERETTLPARYVSSSSAISANSKKIDAIYESAMQEMEAHVARGKIGSSERATRKEILQRGFVMYDMVWSPESSVRYWQGSTSFVGGRIYFGLPYTQNNRTFNLEKWLKNVSYTRSDGYYHVSMPNVSYPGNDCSSFVSMCQFGMNTAYSALNTYAIYSSTQYKTVTNGFTNMIPGDILVKQGHVAMFLYYVTSDRIMVLEQGGGSEPNTISCNIKTISGTYRPQGYRVRRKASLPSA